MPFRSRSRKPKSPLHQNPAALRQARQAAKLKQVTLAAAAGISPSHLSELENGQRGASEATLARLAAVLKLPVAQLERPKSHECAWCAYRFDLPADGRAPLHQVPGTAQWCPRGNAVLAEDQSEPAQDAA